MPYGQKMKYLPFFIHSLFVVLLIASKTARLMATEECVFHFQTYCILVQNRLPLAPHSTENTSSLKNTYSKTTNTGGVKTKVDFGISKL